MSLRHLSLRHFSTLEDDLTISTSLELVLENLDADINQNFKVKLYSFNPVQARSLKWTSLGYFFLQLEGGIKRLILQIIYAHN